MTSACTNPVAASSISTSKRSLPVASRSRRCSCLRQSASAAVVSGAAPCRDLAQALPQAGVIASGMATPTGYLPRRQNQVQRYPAHALRRDAAFLCAPLRSRLISFFEKESPPVVSAAQQTKTSSGERRPPLSQRRYSLKTLFTEPITEKDQGCFLARSQKTGSGSCCQVPMFFRISLQEI